MLLFVTGCAKQLESNESSADITDNITADISVAANNLEISSELIDDEDTPKAEYNETDIENVADTIVNAYTDGFIFIYNGINIYLGEYTENILSQLEPETDYYEMQSCSFDGIAKIYYYGGFEISTYLNSKSDKDRVFSVTFDDDSVSTAEGISIGQTYGDMISIYGTEYTEYEEIPGFYKYIKNGTGLSFNIQDDMITVISYEVLNINN